MRILVLSGILVASLTACANSSTETKTPTTFANLNSGESLALPPGGRGAYATWHAGTERSEQAACVEPPQELGAAAWRRFEICMAWFNGLTDRPGYRAQLEALQD